MLIQNWQWMAVALIAITFAGTMRSITMLWLSLASTAIGAIVWADPTIPNLYQLLIFGAIALGGIALSQIFIKPKDESEKAQEEQEPVIKAPNPRPLIHRSFTLSEPIIDGFGEIEVDGVVWRVRGEDSAAGERIYVMGVDGLERDLLIVTKAEWAEEQSISQ